jgi:hypothetical protein
MIDLHFLMREGIGRGSLLISPVYFCSDYPLLPASLAIEIKPVDTSGSVTKKRGVVIRSASELEAISGLLSREKVSELAKRIDRVNPKGEEGPTSDVFQL